MDVDSLSPVSMDSHFRGNGELAASAWHRYHPRFVLLCRQRAYRAQQAHMQITRRLAWKAHCMASATQLLMDFVTHCQLPDRSRLALPWLAAAPEQTLNTDIHLPSRRSCIDCTDFDRSHTIMLMPRTLLRRGPRSSLAIAMLVSLAAFSTVACSTTATDPASADTNAARTGSSDAGQPRTDVPDKQAPAAHRGTADEGAVDENSTDQSTSQPANSDTRPAVKTRDFSMHPGDTTTLADNGSLRYLRMVNDSRCMPNVQCIWAGNAELSFQWQKPGGGQETFSLNTSPRGGATEHGLDSQRLTLVSLARGPAPEATLRIEPAP